MNYKLSLFPVTRSRLFLVPVVTGPVNVSVASLDDTFYQRLGLLLLNLPAAVTHGWNLPELQGKACSRHFLGNWTVDIVCTAVWAAYTDSVECAESTSFVACGGGGDSRAGGGERWRDYL